MLKKIDAFQKHSIMKDNREWIDNLSKEAINNEFYEKYIEANMALLEITFPEFGNTVIYEDLM